MIRLKHGNRSRARRASTSVPTRNVTDEYVFVLQSQQERVLPSIDQYIYEGPSGSVPNPVTHIPDIYVISFTSYWSGSARVFGYTVYRGFLNRVYSILQLKYIRVFGTSLSLNFGYKVYLGIILGIFG